MRKKSSVENESMNQLEHLQNEILTIGYLKFTLNGITAHYTQLKTEFYNWLIDSNKVLQIFKNSNYEKRS